MVKSEEDLEGYLNKLDRHFERSDDGTYLVSVGASAPPVAVRLAPPVLVAQTSIGSAPSDDGVALKLFRRLLELNATDLMHASYALEGDTIALTAALELEGLDLNELEAVLADMDMALAEHVPVLRELAPAS